jgi:hypothetical protein
MLRYFIFSVLAFALSVFTKLVRYDKDMVKHIILADAPLKACDSLTQERNDIWNGGRQIQIKRTGLYRIAGFIVVAERKHTGNSFNGGS